MEGSPGKGTPSFYSTSVDKTNQLVEISADSLLYPPKRRRNRLSVSCLNCKKRKVKCDRRRPVCGTCAKNNLPIGSCVYSSYLSIDTIEKNNRLKDSKDVINQHSFFYEQQQQQQQNHMQQQPQIPNGLQQDQRQTNNITHSPDNQIHMPPPAPQHLPQPPPQSLSHPHPHPQSQQQQQQQQPQLMPPARSLPFPPQPPQPGFHGPDGMFVRHAPPPSQFQHHEMNAVNGFPPVNRFPLAFDNPYIPMNPPKNTSNATIPVPVPENHNIPFTPTPGLEVISETDTKSDVETNLKTSEFKPAVIDAATTSLLKNIQKVTIESKIKEQDYLKEIERLKQQIELLEQQKATSQLNLKPTNDSNHSVLEESVVFKGLKLAPFDEFDVAKRSYRVEKTSSISFYGPSCWRVNLISDKPFGSTLLKLTDQLKEERKMWKLKFQSDINALYDEYERKLHHGLENREVDYKSSIQNKLLELLSEILPSYDVLNSCIDKFFTDLKFHIFFIPEEVIRYYFRLHFIIDEKDPKKIRFDLFDEKQDFSRISSVLILIKVVMSFYPLEFWDDKDVLFWFAEKLSDVSGARWKTTIPTFITEMLFYFIKLRNLRLHECGDLKDTSLFATRAIQMALNMGVHRKRSEVLRVFKKTERSVLDLISDEEWSNMWIFVQFIDAQVAFISGVPPLIAEFTSMDYPKETMNGRRSEVIRYYKEVNKLLSFQSKNPSKKLSLLDIEELALDLEKYYVTQLNSLTKESLGIQQYSVNNTFISYSFKLKIADMLLTLYLLTHRLVRDVIEDEDRFQKMPEEKQKEYIELETRYKKRAIQFCLIVLTLINHLISRNLSGAEGRKEISSVSVELRSLFLKILNCLCSHITEAIFKESNERKLVNGVNSNDSDDEMSGSDSKASSSASSPKVNGSKSPISHINDGSRMKLLIDDLDIRCCESLMFPHLLGLESTVKFPDLVVTQEKISLPFKDAKCLLPFLNGFFYNTQRSDIASVYTFYAIYKYCFLLCSHLKEKVIDEGEDAEEFLKNLKGKDFCERYRNVNTCWFSSSK